jgi:hypothetical protein
MPEKMIRRGFDPADSRLFSDKSLTRLASVRQEIEFLLDRDYPADSVMAFVGGHHQLAARQRLALQRATAPSRFWQARQSCLLPWAEAAKGCLLIDGFNLIITLEVALSGSVLLLGSDGALRDLAGLRGTYRLIPQTDQALTLIGDALGNLMVPDVLIYLDAPVSNSGRLRARIIEASSSWKMPVKVELVPDADRLLTGQARIVTSDSLLLDLCTSWFNLAGKIVGESIHDAWIIDFSSIQPGKEAACPPGIQDAAIGN